MNRTWTVWWTVRTQQKNPNKTWWGCFHRASSFNSHYYPQWNFMDLIIKWVCGNRTQSEHLRDVRTGPFTAEIHFRTQQRKKRTQVSMWRVRTRNTDDRTDEQTGHVVVSSCSVCDTLGRADEGPVAAETVPGRGQMEQLQSGSIGPHLCQSGSAGPRLFQSGSVGARLFQSGSFKHF